MEVTKDINMLPDSNSRSGLSYVECKFVTYVPSDEYNGRPDMHYVKEVYHYKDGSNVANFRPIKNYKRLFWITKPIYRKYKDKKESELLSRVDTFKSTQSDLGRAVASKLGSRYIGCKYLRDVADSPYFYGGSTTAADEIMYRYAKRAPDNSFTNNELATLDIEVDTDTNEIILISVCRHKEIYTTILRSMLPHNDDKLIKENLNKMFRKYIPDETVANETKLTYDICDTEVEVIRNAINTAHRWQPDFLAIWNMAYDIPEIVKRLEHFNIDPKDVFSDPRLDDNLKYFKWKQGVAQAVTESGKVKSRQPREIWSVVTTPASFYIIDAMTAYNYVRAGQKQNPTGYSLNAILDLHLGSKFKKLHFDDENTIDMTTLEWHKYMVANKPLEYIIYNQWDTMSMIFLDDEIKDLQVKIRALSMLADYDNFNSGPKKIVTNMTWFYLERGRVLGTRPTQPFKDAPLPLGSSEEDDSGWIVMLNIDQVTDSSRTNNIDGVDEVTTGIRGNTGDSDAVSAYPSCINVANVSKDTTLREVIKVGDVPFADFKNQNINIMFGPVNSISYMSTMGNFPTLYDIYEQIK